MRGITAAGGRRSVTARLPLVRRSIVSLPSLGRLSIVSQAPSRLSFISRLCVSIDSQSFVGRLSVISRSSLPINIRLFLGRLSIVFRSSLGQFLVARTVPRYVVVMGHRGARCHTAKHRLSSPFQLGDTASLWPVVGQMATGAAGWRHRAADRRAGTRG